MRRSFFITLLFVIAAGAMLAVAAWRIPKIVELRKDYELDLANPLVGQEIASELRLPTIALFTFRSLAIDYLWIRADNLKQEGQYFDALHLARLICQLQPNLSKVWDFQAWNMAYNISVSLPSCPERWHWVRAGFELLRDEGLVANPRNRSIYYSLAWIFQHKIAGVSDDCHRYYKLQMALEMTPLLGEGNGANEELSALAGAAENLEQLLADAEVLALLDAIEQAEPKFSDYKGVLAGLLEFKTKNSPGKFSPQLHQLIADSDGSDAWRRLDLFVRADRLRRHWKLDPKLMIELNEKYGPADYENEGVRGNLDWRLPCAHAIYWAKRGLEFDKGLLDFAYLSLQRTIYHSLQDLFHNGNMQVYAVSLPSSPVADQPGREIMEPGERPVELSLYTGQDLRMFPVAYSATLELITAYAAAGEPVSDGVITGSVNMLRNGVTELYLTGHRRLADKYYAELAGRQSANPLYKVPLPEFVRNKVKEDVSELTIKSAGGFVNSLLRDSFRRYAMRDDEMAVLREEYAKQIHAAAMAEFADVLTDRMTLDEFPKMRWTAMMDFFVDPGVDPNVKGFLLSRMKLERPKSYDLVIPELRRRTELMRSNQGK